MSDAIRGIWCLVGSRGQPGLRRARLRAAGGARKLRFAAPGRGKRGGYRTIHYYGGDDIPVFLLAALKKGERSHLSQAEKNELRKELAGLAQDYRRTVKAKALELQRRRR